VESPFGEMNVIFNESVEVIKLRKNICEKHLH
jgi:hypothetical protein